MVMMIGIRKTRPFTDWFSGIRDKRAKARIQARIDRMSLGNFGDVVPVGEGVSVFTMDPAAECISCNGSVIW